MEPTALLLAILAGFFLVFGFIGTILPVLPGPPLAWLGLLFAFFSSYCNLSLNVLIICAAAAIVVSILDSILPVLLTKKQNASKYGTRGATIGLIIGFFAGPWGIILGPFCGAFIGELIHDSNDKKKAFMVAWYSFLGFIFGTGLKMITVSIFIFLFIKNLNI